jgi:hypothetical protein
MLSRQLVKSSCCLKMVQNSSLALVYVEHYAFIHFLSLYFNSGIGILFNLCLKIYISKFFFETISNMQLYLLSYLELCNKKIEWQFIFITHVI